MPMQDCICACIGSSHVNILSYNMHAGLHIKYLFMQICNPACNGPVNIIVCIICMQGCITACTSNDSIDIFCVTYMSSCIGNGPCLFESFVFLCSCVECMMHSCIILFLH